jgi:hypothetical protein
VKNGFVSRTATNMINNQIGRIKPEQIEKLCVALHCTPNDLFAWRPDKNTVIGENHPLQTLKRDKSTTSVSELVKDLPLEKISQLETFVNELKSE